MHCSRMRTVRNSSRLLAGGGLLHTPQQAPPGAGTPPRAGTPLGAGPPPGAGTPLLPGAGTPGDTTPPPGDLLHGMLGYHLQGMLGYHPSCGQTHTCKSITFTTSLRTVKIPIFKDRTLDRELIVCAILPLGSRPVTPGGGVVPDYYSDNLY